MRRVVLPILEQREAVSFLRDAEQQQQQQPSLSNPATTTTRTPHNALGWPVFDREGRLIAVAVALDHYENDDDREEEAAEAEGDDDGRRDAAAAGGGRYAAFGAEEERTMVNLCSQVGVVL